MQIVCPWIRKFRRHIKRIGPDKIVIFAVGASLPQAGIEERIRTANLTGPLERDIPLFYLQGGFDYSKLGRMIRILMKLIKWGLMSKKDRTPNEEAMLSAYEHPLDATKPENVRPLIDYIRSKFPIG
jgi:hypothetical protein